MASEKDRTVWSSDQGDLRKTSTGMLKVRSIPLHEQTVYLHRDTKGRGGKAVTLVKKLVLSEEEVKELATRLKQTCGSGGTVKDGIIEIQGEHRAKIAEVLKKIGYRVKISGG